MKKYLPVISLAFLFCCVIGCQDKAAMAELEEFKARAEIAKQNEAAIRSAMMLIDEGKSEEGMKFISPNCIFHSGG